MTAQRPAGREGLVAAAKARPTWPTRRETRAVVTYRPHLRKTVRVALVVGTVIFAINQLDVVLRDQATAARYLKSASYLSRAFPRVQLRDLGGDHGVGEE
jgi:hypothetical protein